MSKISSKINLIHPSGVHAEIRVYPEGCHIVARNEDQYPIWGKSCGSVTSAKRYLTAEFGKGWKVRNTVIYTWKPGNRPGTITFTTETH